MHDLEKLRDEIEKAVLTRLAAKGFAIDPVEDNLNYVTTSFYVYIRWDKVEEDTIIQTSEKVDWIEWSTIEGHPCYRGLGKNLRHVEMITAPPDFQTWIAPKNLNAFIIQCFQEKAQ